MLCQTNLVVVMVIVVVVRSVQSDSLDVLGVAGLRQPDLPLHRRGAALACSLEQVAAAAPRRPLVGHEVLVEGAGASGFEALRRARPQPEQPGRRRRVVVAAVVAAGVAFVAVHGAAGVHRPAARRLQQASG